MSNVSAIQIDYDLNPPADVAATPGVSFSRLPMKLDASIEKIRQCRDAGEAFRLACIASCLDDKEIYGPLGIDQGYFSKIRTGDATLKQALAPKFCQIVGNFIYPEWCAFQLGFELKPIGSKLVTDHDRIASIEQKIDSVISALKVTGSL